jgi:hypothetical protein
MGRGNGAIATTVLAAGLCVVGFFLPWVDGAGPLAGQTLRGYDAARFGQTVADVMASRGGLIAALLLYAVPVSAIDGMVVAALAALGYVERRLAYRTMVVCGAYSLVAACALAAVSTRSNDGLGPPGMGLLVVGGAATLMIAAAVGAIRAEGSQPQAIERPGTDS